MVRQWAHAAVERGQLDRAIWPTDHGATRDGRSGHLRSTATASSCDAGAFAHAATRRPEWTALGVPDDEPIRGRALEGDDHHSQDLADHLTVPRRRGPGTGD